MMRALTGSSQSTAFLIKKDLVSEQQQIKRELKIHQFRRGEQTC
jgi:hypothetical protein